MAASTSASMSAAEHESEQLGFDYIAVEGLTNSVDPLEVWSTTMQNCRTGQVRL